jgi:DNA-binding CsgD family transcriptional regulator
MGSQSSRNYASVVFPELCMLDETLAIFDIYARMDKLRLYSTGGCSFLRYDGVEHKLTVNRSVSGQFLEQEISLGPMDVFLVTTGHLSGDVETELQEKIGTRRVGDSSTIASIMESSVSASSPRYWGIRRRGSGATIAALNQLTDRERDVIVQLLQGSTMKQISSELGISIQTTAKHRVRILEKLSVKNDVQLLLRVFPVLDNHGRLPRKF